MKSVEKSYNDFLNRHFDIINYEELRKYEDMAYDDEYIGNSNISVPEDKYELESFDIKYGKFNKPEKKKMKIEYRKNHNKSAMVFDALAECSEFYENIESFFYNNEDENSYELIISSENMLESLKSRLEEKTLNEEIQKKIVQIAIEAGTIGYQRDKQDGHILLARVVDYNNGVKKYEYEQIESNTNDCVSVSINGFSFKVSFEILKDVLKNKEYEKTCFQNMRIIIFMSGENLVGVNADENYYENITNIWIRMENSIDQNIRDKRFDFFKSTLGEYVKDIISKNKQIIIEKIGSNLSYVVTLNGNKRIAYNLKLDADTQEISIYLKGYEEQGVVCKI